MTAGARAGTGTCPYVVLTEGGEAVGVQGLKHADNAPGCVGAAIGGPAQFRSQVVNAFNVAEVLDYQCNVWGIGIGAPSEDGLEGRLEPGAGAVELGEHLHKHGGIEGGHLPIQPVEYPVFLPIEEKRDDLIEDSVAEVQVVLLEQGVEVA